MIYYRPTDGGPAPAPIRWRPRTAFVMQQLREPILPAVIDYLRRAFLLTNDKAHRDRAQAIFAEYDLGRRARSSVERMAVSF